MCLQLHKSKKIEKKIYDIKQEIMIIKRKITIFPEKFFITRQSMDRIFSFDYEVQEKQRKISIIKYFLAC